MPSETISTFLDRMEWQFKIPTICVVNGEPVLRDAWNIREITPSDKVGFISRPLGGGSTGNKATQVFGIIGLIAITALAPWAAGIIGPAIGITGSIGIGLIQAGLVLGGGLLISTLVATKAGGQAADSSTPGQVYSLTAAGNTSKPLDCIPINYVKLKILTEYASQPWAEYSGDDQYLNLLLSIGIGKHEIHQILIDDTILWDETDGFNPAFSEVQLAFYDPGEQIELFPINIASSSEVSGQELTDPAGVGGGYIGGFIINDAGTVCNKIALDYGFPQGLVHVDANNGALSNASVNIIAEYRKVDNAGSPLTAYAVLDSHTFTAATRTPKRVTQTIEVDPARYEVRVKRANAPSTDQTTADSAAWIGVRAYLTGPNSFDNVQTIAVRMRATAQLSQQSARQIGVIQTRILNVWDDDTSTFIEQPTQNAFWAFWDAATNTVYGARRPISKVDLAKIISEAAKADTRGDTFNYRFDAFTTVPQAFDTILASNRAKHCWVGDVLTCIRDEWQAIPAMLLTDNQISRGSLSMTYIMNDEDSSDAVIGEFLNEDTWNPAELQYPPNSISFTAVKPSRVRIEGVTKSSQLYNEIAFLYRQAQLRRIKMTLDTEHDGRLLKLMSCIKIQSFLPRKWGLAGEVVTYNPETDLLKTNRELDFSAPGQYYCEFRDKHGKYWGPVKCSVNVGDTTTTTISPSDRAIVEADLNQTLLEALDRMDGSEPPTFVMGLESNLSRNAIVLAGRPNGDKVSLDLVIDKIEVHNASNGDLPDQPVPLPINNPDIPLIVGLFAVFRQGVAEPIIDASWLPTAGAVGYRAYVSYDYSTANPTWTLVYEGIQANFSVVVDRSGLRLRVQAFNTRNGPFSTKDLVAPTVVIAPNTVAPSSLKAGLDNYVMSHLTDMNSKVNFLSQSIASAAANAAAQGFLDTRTTRVIMQKQVNGIQVIIQETAEIAETINGKLAAAWFVTINNDGYVSGIANYNDGTHSDFIVTADIFQVQSPAVNGGDPIPFFETGTVDGVPYAVIGGTFFGDGSIKAYHIDVTSISAVSANFGDAQFSGKATGGPGGLLELDFTTGSVTGFKIV